jgi:hypothetical protein
MGAFTVFLGTITGIMITDVVGFRSLSLFYLYQGASKLMAALFPNLVLVRISHTCQRSRNVSASWKVQVHILLL